MCTNHVNTDFQKKIVFLSPPAMCCILTLVVAFCSLQIRLLDYHSDVKV